MKNVLFPIYIILSIATTGMAIIFPALFFSGVFPVWLAVIIYPLGLLILYSKEDAFIFFTSEVYETGMYSSSFFYRIVKRNHGNGKELFHVQLKLKEGGKYWIDAIGKNTIEEARHWIQYIAECDTGR